MSTVWEPTDAAAYAAIFKTARDYFCFRKRLMSACQLIDTTTFGPEALKVIGKAFDAAWAEIASGVGTDPLAIEVARLKLANAVLNVADENSRDVEALKRAALQPICRTRP